MTDRASTNSAAETWIAVVGSRKFDNLDRVRRYVDNLAARYPGLRIVSGGAAGVDQAAELRGAEAGIDVYSYRPTKVADHFEIELLQIMADGSAHGIEVGIGGHFRTRTDALVARNTYIVKKAVDGVAAFWDGHSHGTQITIREAKRLDRPLHVMRADGLTRV